MSATTYKNLVQRREHRERAQPAARARFGLLEKHKDYVQRAKNFHDKEKRILALKRRAAFRNPDEFYMKMNKAQTKDGVHNISGDRPLLTAEELKLMKTQDRSYVQTIKNVDDARIEKLRASLHMVDGAAPAGIVVPAAAAALLGRKGHRDAAAPKRTVFVDTAEEAAAVAGADAAHALFGVAGTARASRYDVDDHDDDDDDEAEAEDGFDGFEDGDDDDDDDDEAAPPSSKRRRVMREDDDDDDADDHDDGGDDDDEDGDDDDDGVVSFNPRSAAVSSTSRSGSATSAKRKREQQLKPVSFADVATAHDDIDDDDDDDDHDGSSAGKKKAAASAGAGASASSSVSGNKRSRRALQDAYDELGARAERSAKLGKLLTQMDSERELLKPGRRTKIASATATSGAVYKWRAQRKR